MSMSVLLQPAMAMSPASEPPLASQRCAAEAMWVEAVDSGLFGSAAGGAAQAVVAEGAAAGA